MNWRDHLDDSNRSNDQPRAYMAGDTVLVLPPSGGDEDREADEPRTRWLP